jgi:hypothetical protein
VGGSIGYEYFGEHYRPAPGFSNRVGIDNFSVDTSACYFVPDHMQNKSLKSAKKDSSVTTNGESS